MMASEEKDTKLYGRPGIAIIRIILNGPGSRSSTTEFLRMLAIPLHRLQLPHLWVQRFLRPFSSNPLKALKLPLNLIQNYLTAAFPIDRKSTRLNSSHVAISYAVFCLK